MTLIWDLLNDGMGNPKNSRSMLFAHQSSLVMSLGVRKNAEQAVRAGIRHILFLPICQFSSSLTAPLGIISPVDRVKKQISYQ